MSENYLADLTQDTKTQNTNVRLPRLLAVIILSLTGLLGYAIFSTLTSTVAITAPATVSNKKLVENLAADDVKTAIQQVLNEQVIAWNKGNLEGFMAGYWQSPDLSFFSGTNQTRGWQPTLDRYRKRYQSEGREMGTLSFNDLEIQTLSTDSAFVRGRWQLVLSKETVGGLFTLILQKRPEGWRIIHDHTS
jgi:beta-aspartyl-peptidase (threonine type)